jgi:hypothetical protein
MSEQVFVSFCKKEVLEYYRLNRNASIAEEDIYVVWL